jgi:hypothetical protein
MRLSSVTILRPSGRVRGAGLAGTGIKERMTAKAAKAQVRTVIFPRGRIELSSL